ncbi:ATP-binding protein [Microlunatus ginsengisoli]|uniref:AAA family ATPase n=1 Tax=Microlunatus ginsengisoli TaxID=363863 RepID=A0ABP6ZXG4_9ACTN
MSSSLLERSAPRAALAAALADLRDGGSGVVLIAGEAGIGKSTLLSAVLADLAESAGRPESGECDVRVLRGACDDLVAANPLGPILEATRRLPAPASAAPSGSIDPLLPALVDEFERTPTVLAIEDLHWADDATLDVLAYLARRIDRMRLLIVVTYRDDEVAADHPVQRFLAAVPTAGTTRLTLEPLSEAAVERLSAGSGWDGEQLYAITGGNPFYLTETLAAPADAPVPRRVSDAVLARLRRLSPPARRGVERMSVWPGVLDLDLAGDLLGADLDALAEAEQAGVIRVGPDGLTFRHELARRATEASLSQLQHRRWQRAVTEVLRSRPEPDLPRLVHHAIRSGDSDSVAEFAPRAGAASSAAGAHRQALVFYAAALEHRDRLAPDVRVEVLDGYAWELYNAYRFADAVEYATRAVAAAARLGDRQTQAGAMGRLSRHLFMQGEPDQARDRAIGAVELADDPDSLAAAQVSLGALMALDVDCETATEALDEGRRLAESAGRTDLVALTLNYDSLARPDYSADDRLDVLRHSIVLATRSGAHEFVARGYTNLGELLYRYGRYDDLDLLLGKALRFTRERGFWSHSYNLEVHQALLTMRRGDWAAAESALRDLTERHPDPGMLALYGVPPLARLLARRGDPAAEPLLRESWERARRQRMLIGFGLAGAALLEWAWLNDDRDTAAEVVRTWSEIAGRPTATPLWAEIRRYAARAGISTPADEGAFTDPVGDDSADPWQHGLAGDWSAAAAGWAAIGDRYERALELADSGETEPTLAALGELDGLGATAASVVVRRRLRGLGVSAPRGPRSSTRENPGGLTGRQLDIARLLADGLTNVEIADRLVLSVRTVDHHVSTILAKLGVDSRRAAAAVVRSWP